MSARFCAYVTSPLYLFITSKRLFELFIAMDRFAAAFFPMRYHVWSCYQRGYKVVVGVGFIVGLLMSMLVAVDMYDNVQVLFCSPRNVMSVIVQLTHVPFIMVAGTVTGLLYMIIFMFSNSCVSLEI